LPVDMGLWRRLKDEAYRRVLEDIEIGYMDSDIVDVILFFFKRKYSFTTSSCSGRITVVDAVMPWKRKDSTVIFKKHSTVSIDDVVKYLSEVPVSRLWLIVTGPIIHVNSAKLSEAREVIKIARDSGFKHSGIMSMGKKGIISELRTGIRIAQLLKDKERLYITRDDLEGILRIFNEALLEGKKRLKRLEENLRRSVS